MQEHSVLDRLEARIDHQAARLDALYAALEAGGVLEPADAAVSDALFDELVQIEDSPLARDLAGERRPRAVDALHLGGATGE
ncbi:MAG TPA: hypothetical protein VE088_06015 [Gaiellaceae bacterium]|jgi:hypothetical protein|nr:hypothetical protein [Gaiellaceae bacterium]